MKFFTKRNLRTIAFILILAALTALVLNLYGVFNKRECNPSNLISAKNVEDYISSGSYNTGHGVKYTVKDNGQIKVKGTATDDIQIKIGSGITLTEGKTYTFTCGVNSCGYDTYGLKLIKGTDVSTVRYAEIDETFEIEEGQGGDYTLYLYVKDDAKVYQTFYPVLVEGASAGSFYQK